MDNFILILRYLRNYKFYAFLNILFNLFFVVFSIVSLATVIPFLNIIFEQTEPVYIKPEFKLSLDIMLETFSYYLTGIIDSYESKEAGLVFISLLVVITFCLKNLFRYLARHFVIPIRNGVVRDIRIELNKKILSLPLSYFNRNRKGDLVSTLTSDVVEIENSILSVLEVLIKEPVTVIAFMATLFAINPTLTMFVLVLIIVIAVFVGTLGRTLKKSSFEGQNKLGFITSLYDETISGMRIIKAFTAESYRQKQFEKETLFFNNIMNKVLRKRDLSSPLTEFLGVMIFSSVIWFGGKEVLNSNIEPSVLIFYLISFAYIIAPAKNFSTAYYNVQKGLGSVQRINKILHEKAEIKEAVNPIPKKEFKDIISFENVSFSYNNFDERQILNEVSFTLKKGNVLALVGPSGAGKTTLADLLPRFYDIDSGSIKIDGEDIRNYSKFDLRNLMGVVSQESILFNDTVRNNIAFGIDAAEEQIIEAARVANAHDFIMQMPQGYDTTIGDRGQNLSGGQKQRLTIARAVLKNPPILILDEATSALDSESEKLVQDALIKLMRNRTSIVIAHRLSTIQFADEILVVDQGKIIEKGNHISLLAKNGLYKKLVELQAF
jgi:ATP-binding cassette, subfamily B, bacterial MsbA